MSTLFGSLRSLRAHLALDGVSWVQRGSVEIAVGHRSTACHKIHAVVCSLPWASLLLGAGSGRFARAAGLGRYELCLISQHRMHDNTEAARPSDYALCTSLHGLAIAKAQSLSLSWPL